MKSDTSVFETVCFAADRENPLAETVRAAQRGDRKAFGRLIESFERTVYAAVFRRLGNHAEAQELCQDVFLQAMRKLDQLENPRCFGGWIRAIAARMAINYALRRGPRMSGDREMLENGCVEKRTPLAVVLTREREDQVRRGLGRLRAMDRETLEAFYFEGRSLVEMSRKFGTPVGTIKRRLHVARKRLAKELEAPAFHLAPREYTGGNRVEARKAGAIAAPPA